MFKAILFGIFMGAAAGFLFTAISRVGAEPWSSVEIEAEIEGGVITTAPQVETHSFNRYDTTDHSARLEHLRKFNAPPVNQAPDVVIENHINNEITIDRKRHGTRQRRARQHTPTPLEVN